MRKEKRNSNIASGAGRIRRFLFAAAAAVILAGCAPQSQPAAHAEENETPVTGTPASAETTSGKADAAAEPSSEKQTSETQSAASVKEEEKVTLVIPTVYENVTTQEEADQIRDRNGYESATLEEDGSLTIVMSRSQYDELLSSFRESVDRGIAEIISEDYGSSIEKIEYNDDYSVFTVTVSTDEIGIVERQTADELVMYGTLYHIYTAGEADHIQVDYVNRDSGEIIESADSGSLDNAY